MKIFNGLLLVILPLLSFGQKIGLHFAPNYTKHTYLTVLSGHKATLGFRSGISYQHDILKRNSLELGVFKTQLNQKFILSLCLDHVEGCAKQSKEIFNYVEIPLTFKTRIGSTEKKIISSLVTGGAYLINTSLMSVVELQNGEILKNTSSTREPNIYSFHLGLELEKSLSNHLSFSFSTVYHFGFTRYQDFSSDPVISQRSGSHFNSFRLDLKLAYRLHKKEK